MTARSFFKDQIGTPWAQLSFQQAEKISEIKYYTCSFYLLSTTVSVLCTTILGWNSFLNGKKSNLLLLLTTQFPLILKGLLKICWKISIFLHI